MKLEALHGQTAYRIEIHPCGPDPDRFDVTIACAGRESRHRVVVLGRSQGRWTIEIDGRIEDAVVAEAGDRKVVEWASRTVSLEVYSPKDRFRRAGTELESDGAAALKAQMPGRVVRVLAGQGEQVEKGQGLVVIEAMKMQNELRAPRAGSVLTCNVREGERVNAGELLFEIG